MLKKLLFDYKHDQAVIGISNSENLSSSHVCKDPSQTKTTNTKFITKQSNPPLQLSIHTNITAELFRVRDKRVDTCTARNRRYIQVSSKLKTKTKKKKEISLRHPSRQHGTIPREEKGPIIDMASNPPPLPACSETASSLPYFPHEFKGQRWLGRRVRYEEQQRRHGHAFPQLGWCSRGGRTTGTKARGACRKM